MNSRSEEELYHLEQCLQSRWGRRLELLELQEPLWKQAHEQSSDALGLQTEGERKQGVQQEGALWEQPDLSC